MSLQQEYDNIVVVENIDAMSLISGEKIQQMADIYYAGSAGDFAYNPAIAVETHKHRFLQDISEETVNPAVIFCYGHNLSQLASVIGRFKRPFILISHNSDEVTDWTSVHYGTIRSAPMLKHWYAQNLRVLDPKITPLPIGIANSQWAHGQRADFAMIYAIKWRPVYFYFAISTNPSVRTPCKTILEEKGLPWLSPVSPRENLQRLAEYEFCICPEGNGPDTHRLWEALYLRTVPIVLKTDFIRVLLSKWNLPIVLLSSWEDFSLQDLPPYSSFNFADVPYLTDIQNKIMGTERA